MSAETAKNKNIAVGNQVNTGGGAFIVGDGNQIILANNSDYQYYLRNRQAMIHKVHNFWIKGVLDQSLYAVARMELGLTLKPDAIENVLDVLIQRPEQIQQPLPPGTSIRDAFDELGKALLILGAPGFGKTTLLLELTKDLLTLAERDANHPLPIVFNLSSWATNQSPLSAWLIDELYERYQVPRKHAQFWIDNDLVIPLLDGLDEVASMHRNLCVEAINKFRMEHGLVPMAVCSRVADYQMLATKLHFQGAVIVQPLTKQQTIHYLDKAGAALAGVRTALLEDEILWELLDSPLMLSIATLAYKGVSAAEIAITGTLEERRKHLFTTYTDAMFKRRSKSLLLYPHQQTIHWLTWLASTMARHNQTVFYLDLIQSRWLLSTWQQRLVNLGGGSLGTLFGAVVFVLWVSISGPPYYPIVFGLAAAVGSLVGGVSWLLNKSKEIRPVEKVRLAWSKARVNLISNFLVGALVGMLIGMLFGILFGMAADMAIRMQSLLFDGQSNYKYSFALLFAEAGALGFAAFNVFNGALTLSDITIRALPNEGIRRSLRYAFLFFLLYGAMGVAIFVSLSFFLGGEEAVVGNVAIKFALFISLCLAIYGAIRNGGVACFQHLILRYLIFFNGLAPWHYIRFLNYASERLFLRQVGGGYIFVHRMLLEYFAELNTLKTRN